MKTQQHDRLLNLSIFLRPYGAVKTFTESEGLKLECHSLTFYAPPPNNPLPIGGKSDFGLSYSEKSGRWICRGTLMGTVGDHNSPDPRIWFKSINRANTQTLAAYKASLIWAAKYWQHYRGDLSQFSYRLGIELLATGAMTRLPNGFVWTHTSLPNLRIFFTEKPRPQGSKDVKEFVFGFKPELDQQVWPLTPENIYAVMGQIQKALNDVTDFCDSAVSCLDI